MSGTLTPGIRRGDMHEQLQIILWPDPHLTRKSRPVETFDDSLAALASRMIQLMREARGVGLAAPQVGQNLRLFVTGHTPEPDSHRVYVNPVILESSGDEEGEEGCLSIPGINVRIVRARKVHLAAQDLLGRPFELEATGYLARIWQHELDHLNGTLILDRMGAVARMANRRTLKELRARYEKDHPPAPRPRLVRR